MNTDEPEQQGTRFGSLGDEAPHAPVEDSPCGAGQAPSSPSLSFCSSIRRVTTEPPRGAGARLDKE